MNRQDDSTYHSYRAGIEMERATRAQAAEAAQAHRNLSALHLARLREIDESCDGSGFGRWR
jgi:hypothetical protein